MDFCSITIPRTGVLGLNTEFIQLVGSKVITSPSFALSKKGIPGKGEHYDGRASNKRSFQQAPIRVNASHLLSNILIFSILPVWIFDFSNWKNIPNILKPLLLRKCFTNRVHRIFNRDCTCRNLCFIV